MVDGLALLDQRRNNSIYSLQFFWRCPNSLSALATDSFILLLSKIRIIILFLKLTADNPPAAITHTWRQTKFRTAFFFITGACAVAFTASCTEKIPGIFTVLCILTLLQNLFNKGRLFSYAGQRDTRTFRAVWLRTRPKRGFRRYRRNPLFTSKVFLRI